MRPIDHRDLAEIHCERVQPQADIGFTLAELDRFFKQASRIHGQVLDGDLAQKGRRYAARQRASDGLARGVDHIGAARGLHPQ